MKSIPHRNILVLLSLISLMMLAPEWQAIPTVQSVQAMGGGGGGGGGSPSIFVGTTSTVSAGSLTTTLVSASNIPSIDGFEMMLMFDPAYLSPTTITVASGLTIFAGLADCLNGVGVGCSIYDGAGVVHIACVCSVSSTAKSVSLFTVTWMANVAISSSNPGSAIAIWCQVVLAAGSQVHVVNVVPGTYGTPPKAAQALFALSFPTPTISIPAGTTQVVTVSIASINGFSSDVVLSASPSAHSVTATIAPTIAVCYCQINSGPVTIWGYVQPNIFGFIPPPPVPTSQLTISTTRTGVFTVKVIGMAETGTGSSISLSTTITVIA